MNKKFLLTIYFTGLLTIYSFGQTFTDLHSGFPYINNVATAWADYDNDGKPDFALIGFSSATAGMSRIYHNDGNGNFSVIDSLTRQVSGGSVSWGDFDHDGDLDLLVDGQADLGPPAVTTIVRNDGNNVFTELTSALPGVLGAAQWMDYDGDGWLDVFTCGTGNSFTVDSARLFHNNMNGTFTEIPTNLPGFIANDISIVDFDNDGDMDIFVTGGILTLTTIPVSTLFRNDGNGNFTEMPFLFFNLATGLSKWADYDHDGKMDLLYDGFDSLGVDHTIIYHNDGSGNFTLINANLPGSSEPGSVDWQDIDGDGDLDILLGGPTVLLRNDGNNVYTDITPADFPPSSPNSFQDIDNDGDLDILFASFGTIFRNDNPLNVGEINNGNAFVVYPNPSGNKITFTFQKKENKRGELNITDEAGQIVLSKQIENTFNEITIDISKLAEGIYFAKMFDGENCYWSKIIDSKKN